MKHWLFFVLLILIIVNVTFTVQATKDIIKIKDKVYPKTVQCPKCQNYDITERSDNPSSLPSIKTMDEIASRPAFEIVSQHAVIRYYQHTMTCNSCGYKVTFTRSY